MKNKLIKWMMRWMPNCDQSTGVIWENYVRRPSIRSRMGAWLHLLVCRKCRDYKSDLKWVTSTLDRVDMVARFDPRYKLPEGIKQRLKASVSADLKMGHNDDCRPASDEKSD